MTTVHLPSAAERDTGDLSAPVAEGRGLPRQRGRHADERSLLASARADVVRRWSAVADAALVADCFDAVSARFAGARVTTYVPLLVERRLREVFAPR